MPSSAFGERFCFPSATANSSSISNIVPWWSWLSTRILPPIRSTSPFVILSPRPVPSTLFTRSLRQKGSNKWLINSCVIPIPVSLMTKRYLTLPLSYDGISSVLNRTFPPSMVNLNALLSMLIKICFIRKASPWKYRCCISPRSTINFSPASFDGEAIIEEIWSRSSSIWITCTFICNLDCSIWLISRISLIKLSRCWEDTEIFFR